jgi:hypothetical protein
VGRERVSRGGFGCSVWQEVIPREEKSKNRKANIRWDIKSRIREG